MKFIFRNIFEIIFVLSLFSFSINCKGQSTNSLPEQLRQKIDGLFKNYDKKDSPGYAIGIIKGTKVL